VLKDEAPGGTAFRINTKGQVVGWSYDEGYTDRAVLWRNGQITNLGGLTADHSLASYAYGLNDVGTIVGASKFQLGLISMKAVRWDGTPKRITALNGLTERGDAAGRAVNNAGVIVGYSNFQFGDYWEHRAVAWTSVDPIDLGTLPGGRSSQALDINSAGIIVGGSTIESGDWIATAWYGLDAAPTDLNGLVPGPGCVDSTGQAFRLVSASAINDQGAIAAWAYYYRPDGTTNYAAFRLTPR
jgi:probable HAF family extracellular repeat protein